MVPGVVATSERATAAAVRAALESAIVPGVVTTVGLVLKVFVVGVSAPGVVATSESCTGANQQ